MEIYTISQYGNSQYSELLEEFWRFKQVVLNYLTNFEDMIKEVINYHANFTSIFFEVYEFIEKEFSMKDFVHSILKKSTILDNHLQYTGIKNDTNQLKIELQQIYTQIQMIFQQQLLNQQFLTSKMIDLNYQSHHQDLEIINQNEIRRSTLSNGRWLIQTVRIQKEQKYRFKPQQLVFTIKGADIVFGIASYSRIEKHNFELEQPIPSSYFVRQDGVNFGFGLTEVQQDFSVPKFSSRKGHKVSMQLQTGLNMLILENLVTNEKEDYLIPELNDDWCYIFGIRFQGDSIIMEE